jgi:signal transduction histidine kinase
MADRVITVAQPYHARTHVLSEITQTLATHVVLLAPALALIVWFLVSLGFRPLTRFAMELKARSPTELQSISANDLPEELLPMTDALNDLMGRLERVLVAQKNFIGDAAHEILTPLAALQVQVQVLDRAKTEQRQARAMHDVQVSLERCVNLARQLLELARNSTELTQSSFRVVDLIKAARYAVEEALPKAHHRQVDLGMLASDPVTISGDELAVHVLLRNLIDNAIKYSPVGSRVDVAIHNGDAAHLVVSDSGPGVPIEEHARLFDRFYRGSNPDIDGTGLGLAIVKEIAQRHRAEIELKSPGLLGGLDVIVRFPKTLEKP